MYPGPDSSVEYSGRGLVIFPSSATVTFSVQVSRDYAYEIILRLQVLYIPHSVPIMHGRLVSLARLSEGRERVLEWVWPARL